MTFDEDVANYDKWRPHYCDEVFKDIIAHAHLKKGKQVVEVGCGTGQATEPFLKIGCCLTAVEYGKNMADFVAEKFRTYSNFLVQNIDFEHYQRERESVDLVFSATTFHWIPENVGYSAAFDMLKSRGTIALFWNRPFANRADDPMHQAMQGAYKRYRSDQQGADAKPPKENEQERYQAISETIAKHGFSGVECRLYKQTRSFNANDYIALLNTYSDHRSMEPSAKIGLEREIRAAIDHFGGTLRVHDTIDLYLAKKP